MWYIVLLKRASRYVLFDPPSQPVAWVGQVLLIYFTNKDTEFESDSADLLKVVWPWPGL